MPRQLAVAEVLALLSEARPPLLLDVREPWEAQTASIRTAGEQRLIPMGQIPARAGELDPAQPIVVYCHHGMRSLQVVAFLERQGFESVYNLAGGIDAWSLEVDPSVPRY
ncbi:sulfurtransferase [Roseateles sp. DAIF2]|uniref:rhodanese-like domain-containing protein n=1 Tax=Roseateles sp. DAIF2 TaxID=2714952 RepID=UPI0018A2DD16|nr:rhodanese-like domain-containing protein [Roseateles sp. DAIF2]QPF74492.1 sulfurtransferase [Roseateles sp. DAIF2]